jgi:hypothetical protein
MTILAPPSLAAGVLPAAGHRCVWTLVSPDLGGHANATAWPACLDEEGPRWMAVWIGCSAFG